ncbi:MAG: hypothetical protein H6719_33560 [Sandaracinaceae bacterium]|nr:hypothetical protein [Sandaracinaceae bacterium]
MDLKKLVAKQGMKLMQDPRVAKVMQNERVMKGMMSALSARAKAQESVDEAVQKTAKRFGLVTKSEVRELKRSMRKLETQLKKAQRDVDKAKAAADKSSKDKASDAG